MLEKIALRARTLVAYTKGGEQLQGVSLSEAFHSAFQTYGLKKWLLKRRAQVDQADVSPGSA
jgi:hypothetical protein